MTAVEKSAEPEQAAAAPEAAADGAAAPGAVEPGAVEVEVAVDGAAALGAQRTRRAWRTTLTALGGKGLGMLLSIISVPLTINFLDRERYGLWLTIGSMLSWLAIADLGLGAGLTQAVASRIAADDREGQRELVSTTMLAVTFVALALAAVFAVILPFVPWDRIFAVSDHVDRRELLTTVALCGFIFFPSMPLGLVDKIYAGFQEGYLTHYWATFTNVVTVAALVIAVRLGHGLPGLVLALSGVPLLVRVCNTAYLFGWRRPWLRPKLSAFRGDLARQQLKIGGSFLLLQLVALIMWQSDNIVVAQLFGVGEVGPYALGFRLGAIYMGFLNMWLDPLWPAYADAAARGDDDWIRRSVSRTKRISLAATAVPALAVAVAGGTLIRLWARTSFVLPSRGMVVGVAVYMMIMAWAMPHAVALNGLGRLQGQMRMGAVAAVINLGLSLVLGRLFGPSGVCWATCAAALIPAIGVPIELHLALKERAARTGPDVLEQA
jgi:O-antigen/teichoic acid export membrane protein